MTMNETQRVSGWRIFALLAGLLITFSQVQAQSRDSIDINSIEGLNQLRKMQQDPHARIYLQARNLGDYHTAIYALHHMLLTDPENHFLQDSLALMYVRTGNTQACVAWCDQCLKKRPDRVFPLNLSATMLESQGLYKPALERYERLYANTGSQFYRYKVSSLQLLLGRHGESLANIEAMLQDENVARELVQVNWQDSGSEVPMRAALLNLRGNLELALNQSGKARKSFRQALKEAPEFELARNNLRAMDDKEREKRNRNDR